MITMEREQKITLIRVLAAAALLAVSFLPVGRVARLLLCLAAFLSVGAKILWEAVEGIFDGEFFGENLLMSIASIGAIILGEYHEAVAIMLFFTVGELFEDVAVDRSREAISSLMELRPDYANMEKDGEIIRVNPCDIEENMVIIVLPGERVPLDGVVLDGVSSLDTKALTGESLPRDVAVGDSVLSGCVNLTGALRVRVTAGYGESTAAGIMKLIEEAEDGKAKAQSFITRFAKVYTPIVAIGAVLLALVPSLITGAWTVWVRRALVFLVASCPCALVISIPLSFFGGLGAASRVGALVKGSGVLEALASPSAVVFDKTGTLTKGQFAVDEVFSHHMSKDALLELAALSESESGHPIARSICEAYGKPTALGRVSNMRELAGFGVCATVDGKEILVGGKRLMGTVSDFKEPSEQGNFVFVAVDGRYEGYIRVIDEIKEGARGLTKRLSRLGVRRTVMLTGDELATAEAVGRELGIDEIYASLLPKDKVDSLLDLQAEGGTVVFVGDGMNDAPVIAHADVGVAMGVSGSDAAAMAADVVLMDDDPAVLAETICVARRTRRIVLENIVFSLAVKGLVLLLGALGVMTDMWLAVFADVGVMILAVLNALRAARVKR